MIRSFFSMLFSAMLMVVFTAQAGVFSDDASVAYSKKEKSEDSRSKSDKRFDKESEESESSDGKMVELCHSPPGNPDKFQTLTVAQEAVSAHLDHGDLLGACVEVEPVDSVEPVKPAKPSSQRTVYGQ